jgi:hypothetical protein
MIRWLLWRLVLAWQIRDWRALARANARAADELEASGAADSVRVLRVAGVEARAVVDHLEALARGGDPSPKPKPFGSTRPSRSA